MRLPGFRPLIAATFAVALVAIASNTFGIAYAHGDLERSKPRANSVVTRAPEEVVLYMSEAPDAVFSEIKVFDKNGLRVDESDTHLSEANAIAVSLGDMDSGTYTVSWQVTSVSDAHRTSGSFRFTVSGGGRLFLGTGAIAFQEALDTRPTAFNTARRWGELAGMALVAGAVGTLLAVWRPALVASTADARARIGSRLRGITYVGLAVVAVAMMADLLARSDAVMSEGLGLIQALRETGLESQPGLLLLLRLLLVIGLGIVWHRVIEGRVDGSARPLYLAAGLSAALMLGRSLSGHASASDEGPVVLNIASDFVHLTAACVWIGGLFGLLVGLEVARREDGGNAGRAVRRFSNLAILCVGLIALTGVYNAWLQLGSLSALLETSYGQVLLVKSSLLMLLLVFAAVNLVGIRLGRESSVALGKAAYRPGLVVRGEVSLAVLVLAMTALLANLPLGRDVVARKSRPSEAPMAMPVAIVDADLNVAFGTSPNRVGTNTMLLELTDALGNPVDAEGRATVQVSRLDREIAVDPIIMTRDGEGRFSARSDVLSIVGSWVANVKLAVPGGAPISIDYLFRIADRPETGRSVLSGVAGFLTGDRPELPRTSPPVPPGPEAELGHALLRSADDSMNRLKSLRECNNINGVVTVLEYQERDMPWRGAECQS